MRVKWLVQEHNAAPHLGLEPRPLDKESSTLTIWPLDLLMICLSTCIIHTHELSDELILFAQVPPWQTDDSSVIYIYQANKRGHF